jgi:hypothetical protein
MIKITATVLSIALLNGCSYIPSFYDDNESLLSSDLRYVVHKLDCSKDQTPQVSAIRNQLTRFQLYSESRSSDDIGELLDIMQETVDGLYEDKSNNEFFCNMKKKSMVNQSSAIADATMGRY